MRTQSKETVRLVKELALAISVSKTAKKAVERLKTELKSIMGDDATLEAGDYCLIREIRNRSDLDCTALVHDLGQAVVDKYMKRTEYEIMTLKDLFLEREG